MEDPLNSGAPRGVAADPLSPDQDATAAPHANNPAPSSPSLPEQAKQKLAGALDGQKGAAADAIQRLADTVQRSGEQFAGRQDWIAGAIGRGASELGDLANSLRDRDLRDLVGEIHGFAIRRSAVFVGAAAAAGFAVARLGKVIAGDLSRADLPTIPEVGHAQP